LEKNPSWHVEDSQWKAKQIIQMIQKNSIEPLSICEIGCGAGEILNQLHSQMSDKVIFTGYEISEQAFQLCQERKKHRLNFELKNLIDDGNDFFDIVLAIDVIEHVEDYFVFLRKLQKKGKYKIFHIPLEISVQTVLRSTPILTGRKKYGHINYFSKEIAFASLTDTNYEIIDWFYTASTTDFPARSLKNFLGKYARKIMYKFCQNFTVRFWGGYSLLILAK